MSEPLRPHDPNHPYVRKLIGCGHGRLFSQPCRECEIVKLQAEYKQAAKTIARVRDRLRVLGAPMPGMTSGTRRVEITHCWANESESESAQQYEVKNG